MTTMRDQLKRRLTTAVISLVLCTVFVSPLAYADDCSDALIAESCACQSPGTSNHEQGSASDKTSPGKKEAKMRHRTKRAIARSATPSIGSTENHVAER
jgi:hypothetical protein